MLTAAIVVLVLYLLVGVGIWEWAQIPGDRQWKLLPFFAVGWLPGWVLIALRK